MTLNIDHMEKMPRLVADLHARSLSLWERDGVRVSATPESERLGEGACISAKLELAINANLRGLGYGG